MSLDCEHGHLARMCPHCEAAETIRRMRAALGVAMAALDVTADNIRHVYGNGGGGVWAPYTVWLEVVNEARRQVRETV